MREQDCYRGNSHGYVRDALRAPGSNLPREEVRGG